MGLDMYLTGRKYFWQNYEHREDERREEGHRVESMDIRLGYWRKHPNLHGYIVKTFAKNGEDDCEEIELQAENLRQIIGAVKAKALPQTAGFFFGESDGSDEERDEDVKTLESALTWLEATDPPAKGERKPQNITRSVYYRGSW